jgi:menaquinone-specific isochorismate synthase
MTATVARGALAARTEVVDDPGDLLATLPAEGGTAWVRRGEGLVGWGSATTVDPGTGPERFARAGAALAALLAGLGGDAAGPAPVAFAAFTFDPRTPGSRVVVPAAVLARRDGRAWLTTVGDPPPRPRPLPRVRLLPPERVVYAGSALPELAWLEAVAGAAAEIADGASGLQKVVLARDLLVTAPAPLDVRLLAARLAARFPSCWTFVHDTLVGATPELLVRRSGRRVTSLVLAGSAPRGADEAEDTRLGAHLRASAKDDREHRLSVASVRDVLAPLCPDLETDPEPFLLRLDNVQHLATRVRGTLAEPATALELAGILHPSAAVCGTPRGLALDRVRALEGMDRGRYSGPVGWVDARGDGEFGIALRCAELTPGGARLFAGAGIVGASLPERELEETRLKLRAVQSALEDD